MHALYEKIHDSDQINVYRETKFITKEENLWSKVGLLKRDLKADKD